MCIYKENINSHNQIEIDKQMKRYQVLQFIKVEKKQVPARRIQRLFRQFTEGQRSNPTRTNLDLAYLKLYLKQLFYCSKSVSFKGDVRYLIHLRKKM